MSSEAGQMVEGEGGLPLKDNKVGDGYRGSRVLAKHGEHALLLRELQIVIACLVATLKHVLFPRGTRDAMGQPLWCLCHFEP